MVTSFDGENQPLVLLMQHKSSRNIIEIMRGDLLNNTIGICAVNVGRREIIEESYSQIITVYDFL